VNKLKSLYVAPYMAFTSLSGLYGLYLLFTTTAPFIALGLATAGLAFPLFLILITILSPRARTSSRLPLLTLVAATGAAMALWSVANTGANALPGLLALACLAGLLLYTFWYSSFGGRSESLLQVGSRLPNFTVQDTNGENVPSTGLMGSPTVFLFFRGNWCPLCMAQIREIADGYKALADRGAQVALISPQPHDNSRELAEKFDVPFLFLVDEGNRAADSLGIAAADGVPLGVNGYEADTVMPTVIITDEAGRIIFLDETDNYRVRPEPSTFITALDAVNGRPAMA
jgi:peroxiredoxin